MRTWAKIETEIEICFVVLDLAVRYGDEDMPFDFPHRVGEKWEVVVEMDTGKIVDWPGPAYDLYMKVVDCGTYRLLGPDKAELACIEEDYVPHGVVPGDYGDYVDLKIAEDGTITNWPAKPDVSRFFDDFE